ncbi:hypothetical protein OAF63_02025 [Saprospiraceae bacterium]|nr:hypothetical protein [Bacteroidota bacterium]MDB4727542.1 hypothetical protein [Saprospiraceae bacterium]MDF1865930.1 hypothetical protein [Saprospiraceae bacterium]
MKPSDFETCVVEWEAKAKSALKQFDAVEQPLLAFIEDDNMEALMDFFHDPTTYRSVRSLRYQQVVLQ